MRETGPVPTPMIRDYQAAAEMLTVSGARRDLPLGEAKRLVRETAGAIAAFRAQTLESRLSYVALVLETIQTTPGDSAVKARRAETLETVLYRALDLPRTPTNS